MLAHANKTMLFLALKTFWRSYAMQTFFGFVGKTVFICSSFSTIKYKTIMPDNS